MEQKKKEWKKKRHRVTVKWSEKWRKKRIQRYGRIIGRSGKQKFHSLFIFFVFFFCRFFFLWVNWCYLMDSSVRSNVNSILSKVNLCLLYKYVMVEFSSEVFGFVYVEHQFQLCVTLNRTAIRSKYGRLPYHQCKNIPRTATIIYNVQF